MPDIRVPFDSVNDASVLAERLCGVPAGVEDIGLGFGAPLVTPGLPGDWNQLDQGGSVLYLRMAARAGIQDTLGAMPALGTDFVDPQGLGLVSEWIENLQCP